MVARTTVSKTTRPGLQEEGTVHSVLKSKNKTVFIFKERLLHTLVCMQDDLKPTQHMHQTHPLLGLE